MTLLSANLIPLTIPVCTVSTTVYFVDEARSFDLTPTILANKELSDSINRARQTARRGGDWLSYDEVFGD